MRAGGVHPVGGAAGFEHDDRLVRTHAARHLIKRAAIAESFDIGNYRFGIGVLAQGVETFVKLDISLIAERQ